MSGRGSRGSRDDKDGHSAPGRACEFCRTRKIKCDGSRPTCSSCLKHTRECVYLIAPPKQRPSRALINAARQEKRQLEGLVASLKEADPTQRETLLQSITVSPTGVTIPDHLQSDLRGFETPAAPPAPQSNSSRPRDRRESVIESSDSASDNDDYDVSTFLSVDDRGKIRVYGPSSALHTGSPSQDLTDSLGRGNISEADCYQLIANAALSRQGEHRLRAMPTIGGIPGELALHLLDLHWNRAHHTFLLTYRPAIMRDLLTGGPYCSDFLLNAIFAVTCKYSDRPEIRGDPNDPQTAGKIFLDRCDELLRRDHLLLKSAIPTISGLVMLGGTFNATSGQGSKGWLFTGYALRMVYDLGLHLDSEQIAGSAEDLEIRRRVFWGAFICDKLQSLYFGRPVTIQLKDAHVSRNFLDTYEENELWQPYQDPMTGYTGSPKLTSPTPLYSVSTFQRFCSLSRIMTRIINRIYKMGATAEKARPHLTAINTSLNTWYDSLPPGLKFEPWNTTNLDQTPPTAAFNIITLLTTYYACIILLHRPFISSGHLKATKIPSDSWKRCNTAARNITSLALAYQTTYGLRRASYLLGYAVYVACTIHARNPASATRAPTAGGESRSPLTLSLLCLDEMVMHNTGVASQARVIRKLMEANNIPDESISDPVATIDDVIPANFDLGFMAGGSAESLVSPPGWPTPLDFTGFPTFETSNQNLDLLFGFMEQQTPGFG